MKKIAVVCAGIALALGASMAHATKPGNNGGGNGGCGVGQTTNGCGGSGSNTATGGAGGNGYGGTGFLLPKRKVRKSEKNARVHFSLCSMITSSNNSQGNTK